MFIVATEYIMTNSKGRMNIQSYVQDMQQVLPWLADHLRAKFSACSGSNTISGPNAAAMNTEPVVMIYTSHARIIHFAEKRITVSKWSC